MNRINEQGTENQTLYVSSSSPVSIATSGNQFNSIRTSYLSAARF